ncbi:hypothetical protein APV28_1872 [Comamonas testosteroni]|nr:hypothetical protein APV28_1872 [Comamonas testosteroni]
MTWGRAAMSTSEKNKNPACKRLAELEARTRLTQNGFRQDGCLKRQAVVAFLFA